MRYKIKKSFEKYPIMLAVVILILSLLSILIMFIVFSTKHKENIKVDDIVLASSLETSKESNDTLPSKTESTIVVDIKGAISVEGTYQMKVGDRVVDVIKKAGDFTDNADKTSVNLAQKVTDEMMIYVARQDEQRSLLMSSNFRSSDTENKTEVKKKLNLNTASENDLQNISGIGKKKAEDIVAYREEHSKFSSIDELKNISGIGDKTLEKLKEEVSVD